MALNHWVGMGYITRDIELRRTQNGTPITTITLAVERDFVGQGEEKVTDYIDCVLWDKKAEFAEKYLAKGRRIVVEGNLQSRKWTDKNGNSRTSWEIRAFNIYFADSKQSNGYSQTNGVANENAEKFNDFTDIEEDGDSLPF